MLTMEQLTCDISQQVEIATGIDAAYDALIYQFTDGHSSPNNQPLEMVMEQWPGGRWFRDLGEGQGHLWGFVQVIKPPTLIEIHGPMFMSYPVASHFQLRLTEVDDGTELSLRHRVFGVVEEEHRSGMMHGWKHNLDLVKLRAESDDFEND